MHIPFHINPCIGLSALKFGASTTDAEKLFGKALEVQVIDDTEEFKTTVWHYWDNGFSLFFDEQNNQLFNCVEINNIVSRLWGQTIFDFKENHIIELFKSKGILHFETEQHDWGEKRLSFDKANIDFYFDKNKLISINYCTLTQNSQLLILQN